MSVFYPNVGPLIVITPWTRGVIYPELQSAGVAIHNASSSAWIAANLCQTVPFTLLEPFTVVKMFWANGAVVSGNVDVGIYTSEGNLLVSAGSTAQAGTNTIQIADVADTVLTPGRYRLAIGLDNTTGTLIRRSPGPATGGGWDIAAFPLPATATFVAQGSSGQVIPAFGATSRVLV